MIALAGQLTVVTYFADDIPMVPAYPTMQNDDTVASYPWWIRPPSCAFRRVCRVGCPACPYW